MEDIILKSGKHETREDGVCLMEAVAYLAGETHSDSPACTDPVLATFGRVLNDTMTDAERALLVPLMPKLVGTVGDHTLSLRRAMLLCDGVVRQIVPSALEAVDLTADAQRLRDLKPITDSASASAARSVAESIAWSDARYAVWYAVWSAAFAARSAARSAESAARQARSTTESVESAAWSAESAAWSAKSAARQAVMKQLVELFAAASEIE
jgi:hypothetical protein